MRWDGVLHNSTQRHPVTGYSGMHATRCVRAQKNMLGTTRTLSRLSLRDLPKRRVCPWIAETEMVYCSLFLRRTRNAMNYMETRNPETQTLSAVNLTPTPVRSATQSRRRWFAVCVLGICVGLSLIWMVQRWRSKHSASTAPLMQAPTPPAPAAPPQRSRVVENPTPPPALAIDSKPTSPAAAQPETSTNQRTHKHPHAPTQPSQLAPPGPVVPQKSTPPGQEATLPPSAQPPGPAQPVYGPYERKAHQAAHPGDDWQRRAEEE